LTNGPICDIIIFVKGTGRQPTQLQRKGKQMKSKSNDNIDTFLAAVTKRFTVRDVRNPYAGTIGAAIRLRITGNRSGFYTHYTNWHKVIDDIANSLGGKSVWNGPTGCTVTFYADKDWPKTSASSKTKTSASSKTKTKTSASPKAETVVVDQPVAETVVVDQPVAETVSAAKKPNPHCSVTITPMGACVSVSDPNPDNFDFEQFFRDFYSGKIPVTGGRSDLITSAMKAGVPLVGMMAGGAFPMAGFGVAAGSMSEMMNLAMKMMGKLGGGL